jgi:hypothetical protein
MFEAVWEEDGVAFGEFLQRFPAFIASRRRHRQNSPKVGAGLARDDGGSGMKMSPDVPLSQAS